MLSFETTCAFFVASLLMAMTPGPDVIIVLTQSSLYGMRAGVLTTLGLMTGLLGHTLAVALGVAAVSYTHLDVYKRQPVFLCLPTLYCLGQSVISSGMIVNEMLKRLSHGKGMFSHRIAQIVGCLQADSQRNGF